VMRDDGRADTAVAGGRRSETRLALGTMLVPIFFAIGFALCIIGTYHRPHPHDIKLAVVGPAAQTARLRAGLQKAAGSAFAVSQVTTVAEATHAVGRRDLNAAYVPTPNPRQQPATVIVASAGGRLVAAAAEKLAGGAARAQRATLAVRELRPLPPGDALGLGVFMFMIICTIAGYLTVTVLFTETPGLPPSRRYPIIAAMAVLVPTIVYLIAGLGFGTYNGSFGTILAFIGVAALYTFVIGLVTRLLQVLLGPPALFVSLAIFVFLNIPSLGATYTVELLPSFMRFLNHFWLGAETTNAERSILYFGGLGVGADVLRLLAWTGVIVALLLLPVSRKLARQRARPLVSATATPTAPRAA
jgi:hypothetical protein